MNGILLIDKPVEWTSFDVVAKLKNTLRQGGVTKPKIGHTGTLDPKASGLLVLVIGDYTKRAQQFSKLDKTYIVEMMLGQTSTTGDEEGDKTIVSDKKPTAVELDAALQSFKGRISQTPPIYSAIKVNGQRAYKLARQGKAIKLQPREVTVNNLTVTSYSYPRVTFVAEVSSGTYIRSLVQDIGHQLRTGAYTTQLRRTKVGDFSIDQALNPENVTIERLSRSLQKPS